MNRKIIDYKVANGTIGGSLQMVIKLSIDLGWQPFGGISYYEGKGYQAMVKYEEENALDQLPLTKEAIDRDIANALELMKNNKSENDNL